MANQSSTLSFNPNPCAVVWQKRFVTGSLKGLTMIDHLSFINYKARLNWLNGVRDNQESLDWRFEGDVLCYDNSFSREEAIEDYKLWAI